MLEKASMLLLSKEASESDESLKTQLILSTNSQPERISGEVLQRKNCFFSDERSDFNTEKKNNPENAICFTNQAFLSTVKRRELAIYCHQFIIGQLLVAAEKYAANQPENIDEYVCKKNEGRLITCLYDKSTGEFQGIKLSLAYIILRGDSEEAFFSYGVDTKKSTVLYSAAKERIPNAIISTCFKNIITRL